MNSKSKVQNSNCLAARGRVWLLVFNFASLILHSPCHAGEAREFFNSGTQQLRAGKLNDAEASLQNSVASQDARVQTAALYNLGLVRVAQGAEILKKSPAARPTAMHGEMMADMAEDANRQATEALAGQDVEKMVAAYVRGRGGRRELRAAAKAVQQALEKYGATLAKWQRAAGDFKSAAELNPANAAAQFNADATDRAIAALVDKINQLQQALGKMAGVNKDLKGQLQKLKGRIPAPNSPPGVPGGSGDDDDDDEPFGLKPGQQEGAARLGNEMKMSADEAGQLLNGFKLGGDRHLPMGLDDKAAPKNRTGKNW